MAGEPVMDVPAAGVSDGGTPSLGSVAGSASMDTSPLAGSPVGGSPAGGSPAGGSVGGSSGIRIGPTPYVPGTERLSFGVFYEGGSSEQIRLRPPQRDLQVFVRNQNDPDASQTVRIEEVAEPLEGSPTVLYFGTIGLVRRFIMLTRRSTSLGGRPFMWP